jgi:hypothetical protein
MNGTASKVVGQKSFTTVEIAMLYGACGKKTFESLPWIKVTPI